MNKHNKNINHERRKIMNKKSIILSVVVGLLILAAGFFGGYFYQKKVGCGKNGMPSGANGNPPRTSGDSSSGAPNRGQGGPGDAGGGPGTSGEIISKDNNKITVKLSDGSTKIVYFSDSTKISKTQTGNSSDLTVGIKVNVNGTTNSDSSITGQNIAIQ